MGLKTLPAVCSDRERLLIVKIVQKAAINLRR